MAPSGRATVFGTELTSRALAAQSSSAGHETSSVCGWAKLTPPVVPSWATTVISLIHSVQAYEAGHNGENEPAGPARE